MRYLVNLHFCLYMVAVIWIGTGNKYKHNDCMTSKDIFLLDCEQRGRNQFEFFDDCCQIFIY